MNILQQFLPIFNINFQSLVARGLLEVYMLVFISRDLKNTW